MISTLLLSGGLVLCVLLLVVALMRLQMQKRAFASELDKSADSHRELLEVITDCVWEVDENGFFTYVSPSINELLGCRAATMLGKTPIDFMSPDEGERVSAVLEPIMEGRATFFDVEVILNHKKRTLIATTTGAIPLFSPEGTFQGYRGYFQKQKQTHNVKNRLETLTPREREVMSLIIDGETNKSAAFELGISTKTVELHRSNMMKKMKAKNLADLLNMNLHTD
jgi:PAS domain S-box-containing protein